MTHFNYFLMPTTGFPSFYFLNIPSVSSIDIPIVQSSAHIAQEPIIRIPHAVNSSLQLSREDLLAAGYERKKRVWSAQEDQKLLQLVGERGVPWKEIEQHIPERTEKMCYSRYRRLLAEARQRWAPEEERKLKQLVEVRGQMWKQFVSQFPNRTWKQLRDKYVNYLSPDINKDDWSLEEDIQILQLLKKFGTKWKSIQQEMGNRTDNQIKNRYYGRLKILLKKKARKRGRL